MRGDVIAGVFRRSKSSLGWVGVVGLGMGLNWVGRWWWLLQVYFRRSKSSLGWVWCGGVKIEVVVGVNNVGGGGRKLLRGSSK